MKVILNDSGPARDQKKSKPEQASRRQSKRSGGFRRRQPNKINDIDELIASGAGDETDAPPTPPLEEAEDVGAAAPAPAKKGGIARRKKAAAPQEEPESAVTPEEPEASEGDDMSSEAVEPSEEPEAQMDGEDATPEEVPATPTRNKFGGSRKGGQTAKSSKPKITVAGDEMPKKGRGFGKQAKEPKQPKEPKSKREPKAKPIKEPKPARGLSGKKRDKELAEFEESFAPSRPAVIKAPESPLSQLITLIEVMAGAAISFFAATQVGNILITNIMSGTLGG